jgi:hypothetical protein
VVLGSFSKIPRWLKCFGLTMCQGKSTHTVLGDVESNHTVPSHTHTRTKTMRAHQTGGADHAAEKKREGATTNITSLVPLPRPLPRLLAPLPNRNYNYLPSS